MSADTTNTDKMAHTIWKFELETTDIQRIEMPVGAEILCIQTQFEKPCIWALIVQKDLVQKRTFEIFGTGHPIPENAKRKYVGSYQLSGGNMVFHCFELLNLE